MHARILRYLDEVVRAGSIRKAAEKLNVASSAVNRQILALEEDLGTPIFLRLPRRLRLTAAGELLIAHVRQTLKEHERTRARILDLRGMRAGEVTIATMNGIAGGLIPQFVLRFRERYPRVTVNVRSLLVDAIVKAVSDGEADIGLGYNLAHDPGLHLIEMFETQLGAVVSPQHPLAERAEIRLADCAPYPLVLADATLTIHRIMTAAFRRANMNVDAGSSTNSIELMKSVVRGSETITFLSAPDVWEDRRSGLLVFLPIRDKALERQPMSLVQRANAALDLMPGLFAEELKTVVRQALA